MFSKLLFKYCTNLSSSPPLWLHLGVVSNSEYKYSKENCFLLWCDWFSGTAILHGDEMNERSRKTFHFNYQRSLHNVISPGQRYSILSHITSILKSSGNPQNTSTSSWDIVCTKCGGNTKQVGDNTKRSVLVICVKEVLTHLFEFLQLIF